MDTRQISAVSIWTPSGDKLATEIRLRNFSEYNFDGTGGRVFWQLLNVYETEEIVDDETVVTINKLSIQDGYVSISDDIVQQWGEDDEIIFDFVCSTLGLTKTSTLASMNAA
jgi:hypothetical protein